MRKDRYLSLDVIRGVAVLGMIFINILVFLPEINEVIWYDSIYEGESSNRLVYTMNHVLFNGKMRGLFTILFGAGIILVSISKKGTAIENGDYFFRKMIWLLIFGLIHGYLLLWHGSILFEYAICGLILYSFRNLKILNLFALFVLILGVYIYNNSNGFVVTHENYQAYSKSIHLENQGLSIDSDLALKKEAFEKYLNSFPPFTKEKIADLKAENSEKINFYRSGVSKVFQDNWANTREAFSFGVYLNILESLALMILGMLLFKSGFFQNQWKYYSLLSFLAVSTGLLLCYYSFYWKGHTQNEILNIFKWRDFELFGMNQIGRVILTFGYCTSLIVICKISFLRPLLKLISNVGKMAFTNYIFQTVFLVTFFYGFRLYGEFNYYELLIISIFIIIIQIVMSSLILKKYQSGPVEYFWKKMSRFNKIENHKIKDTESNY